VDERRYKLEQARSIERPTVSRLEAIPTLRRRRHGINERNRSRFRVQRETYAWSAGSGLRPGAAEHSGLFEHHGLSIRLLRAR